MFDLNRGHALNAKTLEQNSRIGFPPIRDRRLASIQVIVPGLEP